MIDEKKLIEEIKSLQVTVNGIRSGKGILREFEKQYRESILKIIEEQPKVGEWIPCSERLPEDGVDVLVWFEYFRYGNYNRLFQTTGISYIYDGDWSGFVNGESGWHQLSIIAWQPLPEPYHS